LRDYQKAIDSYAQVLQTYRVLGNNIWEDSDPLTGYGIIARKEDSILLAIAWNYKKLGNYQKALDYSNQILQLAGSERIAQAEALNNIGNLCLDICSNLSEYRSAIQAYNQALQLFHHASDAWNGEMMVLANLGRLYQNRLNDYQKALDYYNQALKISQSKGGSWSFWHFVALSGIGTIYRDLGDYEKALNYFNQALKFSPRDPGIFFEAASLEHERGNFNAALRHIEVALKDREKLSQRVMERDVSGNVYERSTTQQERTSYLAQTYKYYELYIDVLMQLHKTNPSKGYGIKALEVSERSRARLLVELLSEAGAEIRKGIDPLLLSSERTLLQQLSNKAKRQTELLSTQHTQEQATALNQEIEALIKQYQDLQAKIRQNSPQYAALTQSQPLTLSEIQQQVLDDDSLLLEYSLGEERSYLWAVTKTGISSYELPKRADIEAAAKRFYEQTGKQNLPQRRGLGAEPRIDTAEVTAQLTQMLLSPVASVLGQKRLIIVSDGVLQYLPFAALPAPDTLGKGNNPVPLIVKHEIVNLPSASTLAVIRQDTKGRKVAPLTVAVLADPVFSAKDERVKTSVGAVASLPLQPVNQVNTLALNRAAREVGATFDRLPYTRTEAQSILQLASAADVMPAFDFAASFATATSPQLSQYRIVHFATHGLLDSVHPELSGVVLSLVDEQGKPQNGFLRLQDIFNLNLPAELVVLSACETGLGQDVKGEGLVGLTRGFMYAGSPRVLVSLWSVNDRGTSELMSRFYKKMLQEKLQPAAALRAAQIEMLHNPQWKSPYYWAAFTLQGEWR
jgi:CHAT domain-containing protein/Flp pilus assembly protein TadD